MGTSGISIIMATYTGERFLAKQLDSLKSQNLQADEIIVSDDHSSDETDRILRAYAKDITYLQNKNARGVISNFKNAATAANKEHYLAFADQDDLWLPNKLELSMATLVAIEDKSLPCMVYSDPIVINHNDETVAESLWTILGFNKYEHKLQTILFGNPAGGCTMLINPELAKYISTIPDNSYMHDAWLTLCAYTFGKAVVMPDQVLKYRQHETNVTFSNDYEAKGRIKRVLSEVRSALKGKNHLFADQFIFVREFYEFFYDEIPVVKKTVFESFLKLENASYLRKKLAFRKAAKL
ncbi:MAG: glycosyltransferase [Chryseobacterium sp.]|nr:MAG: glycosyltransferase [Chryseobacterium sp.]